MIEQVIYTIKPKMDQAIDYLKEELANIRTGRASASLVENILVSYYGVQTPLKQVATITTPEATLIVIQPWDKGILATIENTIRMSNLGVNPINDGNVVRVALPALNQERRDEFVKLAHSKAEAARVTLRNIRKEAWEEIQKLEKNKEISEDDKYRGEELLNKTIDEYNKQVAKLLEEKEKEIRTV